MFGVGHSSTAISAALGMSLAMRYQGKPHKAVAVVGDGAMTGGMAFEAMNDAVQQNADLLVVLNDNICRFHRPPAAFLSILRPYGSAASPSISTKTVSITKRSISSDDRRIRHYLHMANEAISDWSIKIPEKIAEKVLERLSNGELPVTPSAD